MTLYHEWFNNESHILVKVRIEQGLGCFLHLAVFAVVHSLWAPLVVHAGTGHWPVRACIGYKCSMQLCHSLHNLWYWETVTVSVTLAVKMSFMCLISQKISLKIVVVITLKYVISLCWSTSDDENHVYCSRHNFFIIFHKQLRWHFLTICMKLFWSLYTGTQLDKLKYVDIID